MKRIGAWLYGIEKFSSTHALICRLDNQSTSGLFNMPFVEILRLAFVALWEHKLRSILTLGGMIMGITAVVVVVSLIQGFNTYVDEKIAGIGSQSFTIQRFSLEDYQNTDTMAAAQRRNKELTLEDLAYLHARATLMDDLGAKAMPTYPNVKRNAESLEGVKVDGATANISSIEQISISDGRYFVKSEDEAALRVAFIGSDVAGKLFSSGTVIGQEIVIDGLPYRVIGVAAAKGPVFGVPQDTFITIPLKTYRSNFGPLVLERSLFFVATSKSEDSFDDTVDEARFLMRLRHRLNADEKDNFGMITPDAISGIRDRIFGTISIVAIAVPAIALVVGGIVIMNIMLVSVTERTKEIGIRKAIGARRSDILKQFLVEAITLSAIGGVIGVVIAFLIGRIITMVVFPTYLSFIAILIAISVSGGIGVLSGMLPAWKAARIDPIEALRAA